MMLTKPPVDPKPPVILTEPPVDDDDAPPKIATDPPLFVPVPAERLREPPVFVDD